MTLLSFPCSRRDSRCREASLIWRRRSTRNRPCSLCLTLRMRLAQKPGRLIVSSGVVRQYVGEKPVQESQKFLSVGVDQERSLTAVSHRPIIVGRSRSMSLWVVHREWPRCPCK